MRCLCNLKIYKLDSLIFRREINLRKVINLNYQINKIYKELNWIHLESSPSYDVPQTRDIQKINTLIENDYATI